LKLRLVKVEREKGRRGKKGRSRINHELGAAAERLVVRAKDRNDDETENVQKKLKKRGSTTVENFLEVNM